jgi:VIT1/CCC1 family predicted Fe2+/Mn2+ transporter
MRIAEYIFLTLVPFFVTFFVMYLIGSFVSVSTDITLWTMECRIVTALWGAAFGVALLLRLDNAGAFRG